MGVAEGLLTGKRGGKSNPMTLLLYPSEHMRRQQQDKSAEGREATNGEQERRRRDTLEGWDRRGGQTATGAWGRRHRKERSAERHGQGEGKGRRGGRRIQGTTRAGGTDREGRSSLPQRLLHLAPTRLMSDKQPVKTARVLCQGQSPSMKEAREKQDAQVNNDMWRTWALGGCTRLAL